MGDEEAMLKSRYMGKICPLRGLNPRGGEALKSEGEERNSFFSKGFFRRKKSFRR